MVTYSCFAAYSPWKSTSWGFFHVINGQASQELDSKQNHFVRVVQACICGLQLLAELDRATTGSLMKLHGSMATWKVE